MLTVHLLFLWTIHSFCSIDFSKDKCFIMHTPGIPMLCIWCWIVHLDTGTPLNLFTISYKKTYKSAFQQWSATSLLKKEAVPKNFQTLLITIDLGIVCMSPMFDEISIFWHTLKVPNLFYTTCYFSYSNDTSKLWQTTTNDGNPCNAQRLG